MTNAARILAWPVITADAVPMALWSAQEIAAATGGQIGVGIASGEFRIANVATDSREIIEGGLFVAMRGEAMDGHRFIDTARQRGAIAALVERPVEGPHVLVPDSFAALQALGAYARARLLPEARVIGVTGSVGKTGVKEAIFAALDRSSRGRAHRSVKSYNNHVGVPLSLARMPARTLYGVFEMGMNHAGEIDALTRQVRPHVAVITTIAPAHIENLGSEEAIAAAKAEIFAGLEGFGGQPGVAVIPADSPHYPALKAAAEALGARVVGFGRAAHAEVRLLDAVPAPGTEGGSLVTIDLAGDMAGDMRGVRTDDRKGGRRLCYTVAAAGEHWVMNSLAVMAAVRAVGGDLGAAGLALAEMPGMAGRGERVTVNTADSGTAVLLDESYNANPASMRSTLAVLAGMPARRRVAVLGAMKELGDFAPGLHIALAEPLRAAEVDHVILVGLEMTALAEELGKCGVTPLGKPFTFAHGRDAGEALALLNAYGLGDGDALLVKGSNSVGLGALVAALSESSPSEPSPVA